MAPATQTRPSGKTPPAGGLTGAPLRHLLRPPDQAVGRIFYHNLWFRGHSNPRYSALLPRFERLDPYVVTCSDNRWARAVQYRAHRASREARHRAVFALAARHYLFTFSTDHEQVRHVRGPVVVDVDDPLFTEAEAESLRRPNVRAFVVTADWAAQRYRQMGVRAPHHVVPQGVAAASVTAEARARVAALKRPGEVVVGYQSAWLLAAGDHDGANPLYNVDHLFDLWDRVRERSPQARLWLVGQASERVRRRCAGRDDVVLFGRLPQGEALAHVANFDIGLYPRTADHGVPQAVKVTEMVGLGVPVVAYDYQVTSLVRESGAGVLVGGPDEFVGALAHLVGDAGARADYAAAAAAYAPSLEWDTLAARYQRDVLDAYLA
jgi:glycosyltransferase involved in cell wall biosynthesis